MKSKKGMKKYEAGGPLDPVQSVAKAGSNVGKGISGIAGSGSSMAKSAAATTESNVVKNIIDSKAGRGAKEIIKILKHKKGGTVGMSKKPKMAKGGSVPFKALAKPYDKATYADKIAGAKLKKGGTVKSKKK